VVSVGRRLARAAIIALVRLRKHAPEARSTADLVGATLGNRAGNVHGRTSSRGLPTFGGHRGPGCEPAGGRVFGRLFRDAGHLELATGRGGRGAGALLLVVVYVMVVEASARIPDDSTLAWWLRMAMPAVLAAVVLVPLLSKGHSAAFVWPVAIAGVLAGRTFVVVSVGSRR
jgi:hypothetical protein